MTTNVYVMSKASRTRHKNLLGSKQIVCYFCNKPIEIGDKVVYRRCNGSGNRRYFHKKCHDKLYIDLED